MHMVSDIAQGYTALLESSPLLTTSLTAGCLSGLGDLIAQVLEQRQPPAQQLQTEDAMMELQALPLISEPFDSSPQLQHLLDVERILRFVVKGLGGGLIWLAWYHVADYVVQQAFPDPLAADLTVPPIPSASDTLAVYTAISRTALSVFMDQFLASPTVIALWEIPIPILLARTSDIKAVGIHPLLSQKFDRIKNDIRSKLGPLLVENAKVWTIANTIIYNLPFEYRVLASSCTDVIWQSILSRTVNNDAERSSRGEIGRAHV